MYHTLYLKISPILTSHYVFQLLLLPGGGRAGEPREGPPDLQHSEGGLWPGGPGGRGREARSRPMYVHCTLGCSGLVLFSI